jgi:hypothetical protein
MDMISEVARFANHMSSHGEKLDLRLQFIGNIEDGELDSMHGEPEVAENLRMICAQHLYRKKNLFMDYVACRARSYLDAEWEACRGLLRSQRSSRVQDDDRTREGRLPRNVD